MTRRERDEAIVALRCVADDGVYIGESTPKAAHRAVAAVRTVSWDFLYTTDYLEAAALLEDGWNPGVEDLR
jgi:hypothetical protein